MNLGQLLRLLDLRVQRTDLSGVLADNINRALVKIQNDADFSFMQIERDVTILSGGTIAELPVDFKSLRSREGSVRMAASDGSGVWPLTIEDKLTLLARGLDSVLPTSRFRNDFRAYTEPSDNGWRLGVLSPVVGDTVFTISMYRYLPRLAQDTDENSFTRSYPEMVLAAASAITLGDVNDELALTWESRYEIERRKAVSDDTRRKMNGRRCQMGG